MQITNHPFKFLLVAAAIMFSASAFGQTSFKLNKADGHYSITTAVNGVADVEMFLTSSHGNVIIGEEDYEKIFKGQDTGSRPDAPEKFGGHEVIKAFDGDLAIGGLEFSGNILVLKDINYITVPVHLLKNPENPGADIIHLNFRHKTLRYVSKDDIDCSKMRRLPLSQLSPSPMFETTVELADTYGHDGEIEGNIVLDIGCGTPVFFYLNNIVPFIKKNRIRVLDSTTKDMKHYGKGIFASYCKIGERELKGISIGITNHHVKGDALGCVGPAFFKDEIVIDPGTQTLFYIK